MPENPFYGATFAERHAIRLGNEDEESKDSKAVKADDANVEDKAITASETKKRSPRRK